MNLIESYKWVMFWTLVFWDLVGCVFGVLWLLKKFDQQGK